MLPRRRAAYFHCAERREPVLAVIEFEGAYLTVDLEECLQIGAAHALKGA